MFLRLALISALALMLTGCGAIQARKERYAAEQNKWVGRSVDDLVSAKGVPTGTFSLSNGGKIIEYAKSESKTSGGGSHTVYKSVYQNGQWVQVPQQQANPISTYTANCKTIFKASKVNIIESVTLEGNDCY